MPGSGARGRLAVTGHIPVGYHGDPAKTAETFVELDGRRYVIAGDWAEVDDDGTIRLLGRGSVCINTGGEKVYPEEVEEVLKDQPGVRDAVVVGIPDDRFGETVAAVVEPAGDDLDVDALLVGARRAIAAYKVPRRVVVAPVVRGPNGKADYRAARDLVLGGT